jgi:hypothetical protein
MMSGDIYFLTLLLDKVIDAAGAFEVSFLAAVLPRLPRGCTLGVQTKLTTSAEWILSSTLPMQFLHSWKLQLAQR